MSEAPGCAHDRARFVSPRRRYWAPKGSKKYTASYYKAICKHSKAKSCVCAGGEAAHGKACPKNKANVCAKCSQGFKMTSKKTNVAIAWTSGFSSAAARAKTVAKGDTLVFSWSGSAPRPRLPAVIRTRGGD